jgi:hypothetical protein
VVMGAGGSRKAVRGAEVVLMLVLVPEAWVWVCMGSLPELCGKCQHHSAIGEGWDCHSRAMCVACLRHLVLELATNHFPI